MSATVHFFIRTDRPGTDNSAQIYLLFTINRKSKTKISLHKKIPLKKEFSKLSYNELAKLSPELRSEMFCWDNNTERAIKQAPNYEKINRFLDAEKKRANDIILKYDLMGKPLTVEVFKKLFSRQAGSQRFTDYFLNEFETQSNRWASETLRGYKSIVTKIQKFRPNLTLNDIDLVDTSFPLSSLKRTWRFLNSRRIIFSLIYSCSLVFSASKNEVDLR